MDVVRVVFEKGVEARRTADGSWQMLSADGGPRISTDPFAEARDALKLRPVLLTEPCPPRGDRTHLILPNGKQFFGLRLSELNQASVRLTGPFLYKLMNLEYVVGAVGYHCERLALISSEVCREFAAIRLRMESDSSVANFGFTAAAYYEFDALVTAGRRVYEMLRYPIWQAFGNGGRSCPRSFPETLPKCKKLPVDLANRLQGSWDSFGKKTTEYRDCIQHNSPVDFGISYAHMVRLPNGVWTALFLIPENPEVKSRREFKYNLVVNLNALSFGWELANELLELSIEVVNQLNLVAISVAPTESDFSESQ